MSITDQLASLTALEEGLDRMQRSARFTIPIFVIGILATLVAAGVAAYYILTLSSDLREARVALAQSQGALMEARSNLAAVNTSLLQAQGSADPADASSIATAISDVSRSQASIRTASSSISEASAKLQTSEASSAAPRPSIVATRPRLVQRPPTKWNSPQLYGTFQVIETGDGFLALRTGPSTTSAEISQIPVGSSIECKAAIRNEKGSFWRPCADGQGNSGFVSNTYLRQN